MLLTHFRFVFPVFSSSHRLPPTLPFTPRLRLPLPHSLPVVMTPSSRMMLEWSNCPRMPASLRKERRCFSEQPARSVLMATGSSLLLGSLRQPRHTSPKSPGVGGKRVKKGSWSILISESEWRNTRAESWGETRDEKKVRMNGWALGWERERQSWKTMA